MSERKVMDGKMAAAYLGIAARTLARWRGDGYGPAYLMVGALVRYDVRDLDNWLDCQRRPQRFWHPRRDFSARVYEMSKNLWRCMRLSALFARCDIVAARALNIMAIVAAIRACP